MGNAPGWYPDPAARHQFRYWDGSNWSEHVANNGVTSSDPGPILSAGSVPPSGWSPAPSTEPNMSSATIVGSIVIIASAALLLVASVAFDWLGGKVQL